MHGHQTKAKQNLFSTEQNRFIIIYSNSAIDLYTIKAYSLEHTQCYNIVIGKEKYIYILQQVRRDIPSSCYRLL